MCGCAYGGTSWTTRNEAEHVAELLELGPGRRLLDIGAGAGWPALYMARISGCDVTLVDVPLPGLAIAARRAPSEGLAGACWVLGADGSALPFADVAFDAIRHSDVLCCLVDKAAVLDECRRVVRAGGGMVFSVIGIAPGVSGANYERALAAGPPFKETDAGGYPALLEHAGWQIRRCEDLTTQYRQAVRRMLSEEEKRASALAGVFGEGALAELLARRRRTAEALDAGLLERQLISAARAPAGPATRAA